MNTDKQISATDANITKQEKQLLDDSLNKDMDGDDDVLRNAELDNRDEDGDLLNEESSADDISGGDLDIPGAEDDDEDELTGDEDEENNGYSDADTE